MKRIGRSYISCADRWFDNPWVCGSYAVPLLFAKMYCYLLLGCPAERTISSQIASRSQLGPIGGSGTFVQKVTLAINCHVSNSCRNSNRRLKYRLGKFVQREVQYAPEVDMRRRDRTDGRNIVH